MTADGQSTVYVVANENTGLAVSGGRLVVRTGDGKLTTYALP